MNSQGAYPVTEWRQGEYSARTHYLGFWFQEERSVVLLGKRGECPLGTRGLKAVQAGVRELRQQIPRGAGALGVLAAQGVLCQGDGLHRDLGARLGGRVVHVCVGVILRAKLHRRLHGDLCLMGEAMAAIGGWRAGAGAIVSLRVDLGFHLDHSADTGAETGGTVLP